MRQPLEAMQASAGAKRSRKGRSRADVRKARGCCMCPRPHNVQQLRHEALQVLDLRAISSRDIKAECCRSQISTMVRLPDLRLAAWRATVAVEQLLHQQHLAASHGTFLYVGAQ